jgi:hypothetical protein
METLEAVEKEKHSNDLEPVLKVVLVNGFIVTLVGSEVSTVFHRLREGLLLGGTLLNHIKINYF